MGLFGFVTDSDIINEYNEFKKLINEFDKEFIRDLSSRFLICRPIFNLLNMFVNEEFFVKRYNKDIKININNEIQRCIQRRDFQPNIFGLYIVRSFINLCSMLPKSQFETKIAYETIIKLSEYGMYYRDLTEKDKVNYSQTMAWKNGHLHANVQKIIKEHEEIHNIGEKEKQAEIQNVIALWDYSTRFNTFK